jgi:hypothetical protein
MSVEIQGRFNAAAAELAACPFSSRHINSVAQSNNDHQR